MNAVRVGIACCAAPAAAAAGASGTDAPEMRTVLCRPPTIAIALVGVTCEASPCRAIRRPPIRAATEPTIVVAVPTGADALPPSGAARIASVESNVPSIETRGTRVGAWPAALVSGATRAAAASACRIAELAHEWLGRHGRCESADEVAARRHRASIS